MSQTKRMQSPIMGKKQPKTKKRKIFVPLDNDTQDVYNDTQDVYKNKKNIQVCIRHF